jgi:hypothetical protein
MHAHAAAHCHLICHVLEMLEVEPLVRHAPWCTQRRCNSVGINFNPYRVFPWAVLRMSYCRAPQFENSIMKLLNVPIVKLGKAFWQPSAGGLRAELAPLLETPG